MNSLSSGHLFLMKLPWSVLNRQSPAQLKPFLLTEPPETSLTILQRPLGSLQAVTVLAVTTEDGGTDIQTPLVGRSCFRAKCHLRIPCGPEIV